ncbi:MAG: dTDP-glucose 4,6-dehydratase [Candidatus Omnitrophota bacterium]
MRKKLSKILVTGGAGFIGSAFVRLLLGKDTPLFTNVGTPSYPNDGCSVFCRKSVSGLVVVDKLTYAGDLRRLKEVKGRYKFYRADICDGRFMEAIFKKERPDIVVHFAAESHVDRSIHDATAFIQTNVIGTQVLLDLSRKYEAGKFCHVSTDEVYGDIVKGSFSEGSPLKPNSPYAASKAAADLLIKSYVRTYNFPAVIIRPCNNYGPWQYPEKLIPVVINRALQNKKVPVYAKGLNVREWLYVSDCANGILFLLEKAKAGEVYNLGSGHRQENIDVVKRILNILGKPDILIEFVKDRLGHDWRYSLDSSKVKNLGWRQGVSFTSGIKMTVDWNIKNRKWLMDKAAQV